MGLRDANRIDAAACLLQTKTILMMENQLGERSKVRLIHYIFPRFNKWEKLKDFSLESDDNYFCNIYEPLSLRIAKLILSCSQTFQ